MDAIDQLWKAVSAELDIFLVVGLVLVIQAVKKWIFPKVPGKVWIVVVVIAGFFLAWIKTPTIIGHGKEYIEESLKYSAFAVFLHQIWKALFDSVLSKVKGKRP